MVHSHTVHLPLGALLIGCTMCGTGMKGASSRALTSASEWSKARGSQPPTKGGGGQPASPSQRSAAHASKVSKDLNDTEEEEDDEEDDDGGSRVSEHYSRFSERANRVME